mgnify:CR=1 FL=1
MAADYALLEQAIAIISSVRGLYMGIRMHLRMM